MVVIKFGGGCLKNTDDFINAITIVKNKNDKVIIVVSAINKVTNLLIEAIHKAFTGEKEIDDIISKVKEIHENIFKGKLQDNIYNELKKEINIRIERLRKNLYGVCYTHEITDSIKAKILSYGERFSAFTFSAFLKNYGIDSYPFEADKLGILTDEYYDNATANLNQVEKNLKTKIEPLLDKGIIPVITGYFGITPSGKISLFGRNGSDYTASVIAYAFDNSCLEIYKDVDGFMTADPKIVKNSKSIDRLSYDEAAELSYFGAKILHPRTVEPISLKNINLIIKNIYHPDKIGSIINSDKEMAENIIKSITYNKNITILRVFGAGVGYKSGIISEIGKVFFDKKINIYSIITSQTCINLIIDKEDSKEGYESLKVLEGGIIKKVDILEDMALVAVVGEGILKKYGIAAKVFSAVASHGINVEMMSAGASDVAYYFIVKENEINKVIEAVHSQFFS